MFFFYSLALSYVDKTRDIKVNDGLVKEGNNAE